MMQGSLAERLRVLRAQRGLTLVEAAEKTGIGRDTLSDLERRRRHPVMPTLAKIARGYGVPVEELLEEPALSGKADASIVGGVRAAVREIDSRRELRELRELLEERDRELAEASAEASPSGAEAG